MKFFWSFSTVIPIFLTAKRVIPCLLWTAIKSEPLGVKSWLSPFWNHNKLVFQIYDKRNWFEKKNSPPPPTPLILLFRYSIFFYVHCYFVLLCYFVFVIFLFLYFVLLLFSWYYHIIAVQHFFNVANFKRGSNNSSLVKTLTESSI